MYQAKLDISYFLFLYLTMFNYPQYFTLSKFRFIRKGLYHWICTLQNKDKNFYLNCLYFNITFLTLLKFYFSQALNIPLIHLISLWKLNWFCNMYIFFDLKNSNHRAINLTIKKKNFKSSLHRVNYQRDYWSIGRLNSLITWRSHRNLGIFSDRP